MPGRHADAGRVPHLTQVWVSTDGEQILVNTFEGAQKLRNLRRDPRVAVNVVDPGNAWRLAQIRGRVVDVTTEGADDHIDELAQKYLGVERYPFRQPGQVRVKVTIARSTSARSASTRRVPASHPSTGAPWSWWWLG